MGFPEELKAWRQKRGLTQAEAAELFQVTETSYANWETGRKAPRGLARTRVREVIAEGSGQAYRELARFTFPIGAHDATLILRGKQLAREDFDRLKEVVGQLQQGDRNPKLEPPNRRRAPRSPSTLKGRP